MKVNVIKDKCIGCGNCVALTEGQIFDFNDEEPKYYINGMMLAYETEDGLEEVEFGSTFEIGVKYYAMVQLATSYSDFAKYIFADNITTSVKRFF